MENTSYGMQVDSIDQYDESLDFVLTVSESIRKYFIENSKNKMVIYFYHL